jgi:hypothetical protein
MSVANSSYEQTVWNEKSFKLIQVVLFVWHSLTVEQKAIFIGFSNEKWCFVMSRNKKARCRKRYANFRRTNNMTQLSLVTCEQKLSFPCFRRVLILCMLCTDYCNNFLLESNHLSFNIKTWISSLNYIQIWSKWILYETLTLQTILLIEPATIASYYLSFWSLHTVYDIELLLHHGFSVIRALNCPLVRLNWMFLSKFVRPRRKCTQICCYFVTLQNITSRLKNLIT